MIEYILNDLYFFIGIAIILIGGILMGIFGYLSWNAIYEIEDILREYEENGFWDNSKHTDI